MTMIAGGKEVVATVAKFGSRKLLSTSGAGKTTGCKSAKRVQRIQSKNESQRMEIDKVGHNGKRECDSSCLKDEDAEMYGESLKGFKSSLHKT